MTGLSGEFQTDLSLQGALEACAEAIAGLGWRIATVGSRRIISHVGDDPSPRVEILLNDTGEGTGIELVGSDTPAKPLQRDELIAVLDRVRDAVRSSIEAAESGGSGGVGTGAAADAPAEGPPAGWYENPNGPGVRWWDGARWSEHVETIPGNAITSDGQRH